MSLVFDIGANQGRWAIVNYLSGLAVKIIAVEASPSTFELLRSEVQPFQDNICIMHRAVSVHPESITFYNSPIHTISTTYKEWLTSPESRFYGTEFEEIEVPTITLDTMIDVYGIPDLIKIDVECGEYDVVKSLTQKVPLLCFEWAAEVKSIAFDCIDYLQTLGFTCFFVQEEDDYTFRPSQDQLSLTAEQAKEVLTKAKLKVGWGMVWAS